MHQQSMLNTLAQPPGGVLGGHCSFIIFSVQMHIAVNHATMQYWAVLEWKRSRLISNSIRYIAPALQRPTDLTVVCNEQLGPKITGKLP